MLRIRASLFAAATVLAASSARASDDCLYLPVGVNLGGGLNAHRPGGVLLGAEASLVSIDPDRLRWWGGYVDAIHDFGAGGTRFTAGPELGWGFVGIDGGYVGSFVDHYHHGLAIRALLSFAFVDLYARVGGIFDSPTEATFGELGILLKLPFALDNHPFLPRRRPKAQPSPPPASVPDLPLATPPGPEETPPAR